MTKRDTGTGDVLEQMILPALERGGYHYERQVHIGERLGAGKHMLDILATKEGKQLLISMKWQQVKGTAEQKVPFEVICLIEALDMKKYDAAYLVLGGEGWTLRDFFCSGGLMRYISDMDRVHIHTFESFIAHINQVGL